MIFTIDELTECSPRAQQPASIKVNLLPHQLSLLHQALDYEIFPRNIFNSACINAFFNLCRKPDCYTMHSRVGILGDKAGAGKSMVVLAMIASRKTVPVPYDTIHYNDINLLSITHQDFVTLNVNVIIVHHTLFKQWTDYLSLTNLTFKCINIKKDVANMEDENITSTDVFLVTASLYKQFTTKMSDIYGEHTRVQRIFFDEFDSLHANGNLVANFYWLVTSAYVNVIDPNARRRQGYRDSMDVYRGRSILHRFIRTCDYSVPITLMSALVVKNKDIFVNNATNMPDIQHYVIVCKDPHTVSVLLGVVSPVVIDMLNAANIEGAITELGLHQVKTEYEMIHALTRESEQIAKNMEIVLSASQQMHFSTPLSREMFVAPTIKSLHEHRHRIATITERIVSNDASTLVCCICFERPERRTIIKCCANSFCFGCLMKWVQRQNTCPMCKHENITKDFIVVMSPSYSSDETSYPETVNEFGSFPHSNLKLANIKILLHSLNQLPSRHILLFSSYDSSFSSVIPVLVELNITFAVLKGNAKRINYYIEMYNKGEIKLLLLNTTYAGSGLNLTNTTDVVMFQKFDSQAKKQIIGRAQRIGRTCKLCVHYLLNENEV